MSENPKNEKTDKLLDHDYDGIRELDNQLPRWWLWLFYVTIGFGAVYYAYYEIAGGPTLKDEYQADVAGMEAKEHAAAGNKPAFPDEQRLAAAERNPEKIASGKAVFAARCVACHGDKGQGLIGPNLTDDFWLHGDGKIATIAKMIHDGQPDKGMPPWGPILSEDEVYAVAAFVRSIRGTNPPGAKAPQGTEHKESR